MAQLQTTAVTGSLTVTGQIIAQTLNVQQVTSSIVYSSGSNRFGNLVTDVQQFTGSLRVTGSGDHYIVGGNIGIGTTAPAYTLDVIGASRFGQSSTVIVSNDGTYGTGYGAVSFGGNTNGFNRIFGRTGTADGLYLASATGMGIFFRTNGGTIDRMTLTASGSLLVGGTATPSETAWFGTAALGINGTNKVIAGYLGSSTNGAVVGGHNSALNAWADLNIAGINLIFRSSETEFMRLTSIGNLGIGTTAPIAKLQIAGTSGNLLTVGTLTNSWAGDVAIGVTNGNGVIISKINTANDTNRVLVFYRDDTNGATIWGYTPTGGSTNVGFQIRANASSYFNGGNIGIGTTSPSAKLQISGSSNVLNVVGSGSLATSSLFSVDGAFGRLFEVTDDLSNSLFSVNTIAGLPVIEAFADYSVNLGTYSAASGSTMRITGSSVGIGTTAPSMSLQIDSTGFSFRLRERSDGSSLVMSGNQIQARTSANAGSPLYLNFTNGGNILMAGSGTNLGIGTTAPSRILHVLSSVWDNTAGAGVMFENSNTVGAGLTLKPNASVVSNGSSGWAVYAGGPGAAIGDGNLGFWAHGTNQARLVIQRDGNVGIGTTIPSVKLHVIGDTILQSTSTGNGTTAIRVNNSSGTQVLAIGAAGGIIMNNSAKISTVVDPTSIQPQLELYNAGTGYTTLQSSTSYGLLLNPSGGNVGIGISSADAKLTVSASSGDLATFYTGTTKRLTITTGGNLSFSTSTSLGLIWSPASLLFEGQNVGITARPYAANYVSFTVAGATSQTANLQTWQAQGGTVYSVVDAAGDFGIQATASIGKLQLGSDWTASPGGVNAIYLSQAGFANVAITPEAIITSNNSSSLPGGTIGLALHNNNVTAGAFSPLLVFSKRETGSSPYNASIAAIGARTVTGTGNGDAWIDGDLMFYTAPTTGTGLVERLRIIQDGNVGIGTTAPAYKLDVNGDARFGDGNNFNPLIQYAGSGRAAGSPGYSFVGDLDTGMYNPNLGNTIAFSTAGTERIRIISDGNVGIGTTSPGDLLEVAGNVYSNAFNSIGTLSRYNATGGVAMVGLAGTGYAYISAYSNAAGAGKNLSLQMNGGNVGIGTTTPTALLNVSSSTAAAALRVDTAGGTGLFVSGSGNVGIGTTSPAYKLDVQTSGISAPFRLLQATYQSLTVDYPATFTTQINMAFLGRIEYDGNGGVMTISNRSTQVGSSYMGFVMGTTQRMGITDTGNVGIGTTGPTALLHISSSTAAAALRVDTAGGTGLFVSGSGNVGIGTTSPGNLLSVAGNISLASAGFLGFTGATTLTTSNYALYGSSTNTYVNVATGGSVGLNIGNNSILTITGSNVGIGTTNPAYKLDVNGDVRFVGNTYVGGIINAYQGDASIWVLNVGQALTVKANTGNVGIGTTSPAYKLDVSGSGRFIFRNTSNEITDLLLTTEAANSKSKLSFLWYGNETAAIKFSRGGDATGGGIEMWTQATAGSTLQRVTILDNGNVGIGAASPTAKLDVSGSINVRSASPTIQYDRIGAYTWKTIVGDGGTYPLSTFNIVNNGNSAVTTFLDNGNVGIGTTAPTNKFQVVGGITSLSITSSLLGTASYATQALSASYAPGGGGSQWTTTGNNIYYTTGNVGIGTSTIGRKLDVYGDGTVARLQSPTANQFVELEFSASGVGPAYIFKNSSGYAPYGGGGSLNIYNTGNIGFHSDSTFSIMTLLGTGNVGIGSTAPTQKLDVAGSIRTTANIFLPSDGMIDFGSGDARIVEGEVSNYSLSFKLYDPLTTTVPTRLFISASGNIGMGTTSPTRTLDVRGGVNIQSSGSILLLVTGSQGELLRVQDSGSSPGTLAVISSTTTNVATFTTSSVIISGSLLVSGSTHGIAEHMILAISDETTNITTGAAKITFRAPFTMVLTQIPRASLSTASTSGLVTVDINEAGTSILGANKLSIDANELTSTTAATPTTLADTSIADDAQITIDIDGAGTGARGLKVTLYYIKA